MCWLCHSIIARSNRYAVLQAIQSSPSSPHMQLKGSTAHAVIRSQQSMIREVGLLPDGESLRALLRTTSRMLLPASGLPEWLGAGSERGDSEPRCCAAGGAWRRAAGLVPVPRGVAHQSVVSVRINATPHHLPEV